MGVVELILVRHGESTGNVAREEAEAGGAEVIPVEGRDADVGLTDLGVEQSRQLGRFLRSGSAELPTAVWTSPFTRARETTRWITAEAGLRVPVRVDERLRDKELGILDTLTAHGVRTRYPLEDQRRRWLGKFYYRAPGGESWADLALRLRSLLSDLERSEDGGRVLLVSHDAVIVMLRYVCESLDEAQVLALARSEVLVNTGVTRLVRGGAASGGWSVRAANEHDHLLPAFAGADLRTYHDGDPVHAPAGSAPA
jgi:broad specificity phosphatase PhoE